MRSVRMGLWGTKGGWKEKTRALSRGLEKSLPGRGLRKCLDRGACSASVLSFWHLRAQPEEGAAESSFEGPEAAVVLGWQTWLLWRQTTTGLKIRAQAKTQSRNPAAKFFLLCITSVRFNGGELL